MNPLVTRKNTLFLPDASRVIARFFYVNDDRAVHTIQAVLGMSETEARKALSQVLRDYSLRHRNITKIFEKHFNAIAHLMETLAIDVTTMPYNQKILIGAYFTLEYSIDAAAFFNPSIVEHPDQTETEEGETRVILSFRATGEGHISSIVFRTGILDRNSDLTVELVGKMLEEAEQIPQRFSKQHALDESLTSNQYELDFSLDTNLSERIIFPVAGEERHGIEDARFVKFTEEDGQTLYYATFTAYDGVMVMPKLIETRDFYHFKVMRLIGDIAKNKGMALFPRKINGQYAMLCRLDGFNNYIAYSDQLTVWSEAKILQQPIHPYEFIKIGNCGSPIETEEGWLVITHAVGPMREYTLGASLFDLENPEIEIGRLNTPLLVPNAREREGYVPNVVYSCGSMIHNEQLILPYAMSDYSSTYATINVKELLNELKRLGKA